MPCFFFFFVPFLFALQKLWWQNIWPMLKSEINNNEVLAAVLQPVMLFVQEATHTEYDNLMSATMK